ncbi:flagellar export chaperone FliS [Bacillus daqingensis]|uniref:Flagellar secretion chaperone FliS n=1 Tax=Bacillus daqingensis TaxID=872396 RepID=A0ABV9NVQ9_9BACI
MATNNPYAAYKQTSIETKSPGELTLMLYDGCLKFIRRADAAMETGSTEDRHTNLVKAQNIIRELMVTLDQSVNVSQGMMQLYDFILARLIDANTKDDREALAEAAGLVTEFRDTWKEVIQMDRRARHGSGGVSKAAGNAYAAAGAKR